MYEHYGFNVVEEFQIPDTQFNNWVMIREPKHSIPPIDSTPIGE
jgi:hypothetical protein